METDYLICHHLVQTRNSNQTMGIWPQETVVHQGSLEKDSGVREVRFCVSGDGRGVKTQDKDKGGGLFIRFPKWFSNLTEAWWV